MEKAAKKILNYAISHNYVSKDQFEEYLYMLTMVLNIFITDITMLFIGLIMGAFLECAAFWLIYKVLRKFCGGLHFSTSLRCYLSSCIMCPVVLTVIKYVPFNTVIFTAVTILSVIILISIVPVAAVNKPLDDFETRVFGKISRILTLACFIIYLLFVFANISTIAKIFAAAIVSVAFFAISGYIQLKKQHKII